jgi:hypothetical protein
MKNIDSLNRIFRYQITHVEMMVKAVSRPSRQGFLAALQVRFQRFTAPLLVAVICLVSLVSFPMVAVAQPVSSGAGFVIVAKVDALLLGESLSSAAPSAASSAASSLDDADTLSDQLTAERIAAEKVDRFAQAYVQVLKVLSDREPELPAAETSAEAVKVQRSIEADAVAHIKESGLTLREYMEMLSLASRDTDFRDKVLGRIDDAIAQ